MRAASFSGGSSAPVLADIGPGLAVAFVVFILAVAALFWWGARRKVGHSHTTYVFDDHGRAHQVPADRDPDA